MWDDFVDDDDFLAPPRYASDAPELDEVGDSWIPDRGFPDSLRVVRVWADEDGVMEKVVLSPNWREKLKNSSLDAAFREAFLVLNLYRVMGKHPLPNPEPLPAEDWPGGAGWHTLERAEREMADVARRIAELPDEPPTRWVGAVCTGSDYDDGVIIELGLFGEPVSARFDPEWLDEPARSSEICRGVMAAYRRARANYKPPQVEFSQRDLLAMEYGRITRSMLKAFGNGLDLG